jgi:hypothetical protein
MSTGTIFYFAVSVFLLMVIGVLLTGVEFRKIESQSRRAQGEDQRRS